MRHHDLEIEPIPKGKALFINEPWLTDASYSESLSLNKELEAQPDTVSAARARRRGCCAGQTTSGAT